MRQSIDGLRELKKQKGGGFLSARRSSLSLRLLVERVQSLAGRNACNPGASGVRADNRVFVWAEAAVAGLSDGDGSARYVAGRASVRRCSLEQKAALAAAGRVTVVGVVAPYRTS